MNNMFTGAIAFDQDISVWNVESVTSFFAFFRDAGLSQKNYESLLLSWSAQNLLSDVTFDGGNSQFCSQAAINARMALENNFNWTIFDGGINPSCFSGDVDLSITLTDNTDTAIPGQLIDYVVEVTNLGSDVALNASIFARAASGLTDVSWVCNSTSTSNCTASGVGFPRHIIDIASGQSISYTYSATVSEFTTQDIDLAFEILTSGYQADSNSTNNYAQDINTLTDDLVFTNGFEEIVTLFNLSVTQIAYDFSEDNVAHIGIVPYAIGQGFDDNYDTDMWLHLRKNNGQLQIRQSYFNPNEGIWNIGMWQDVFNEGLTTIEW